MSISVDTKTGTVTIRDGFDSAGNAVTGTENLLLQLALDRASANTARVSILQSQLREQTDHIDVVNGAMTKLLNSPPTDSALNGSSVSVNFSADELSMLAKAKDSSGVAISSYYTGNNPIKLNSNKNYNDLMNALKSELNQSTNLNQQSMINYQSLINQRNQMTEWTANLITLLATSASQTVANLR